MMGRGCLQFLGKIELLPRTQIYLNLFHIRNRTDRLSDLMAPTEAKLKFNGLSPIGKHMVDRGPLLAEGKLPPKL